MANEDIVLDGYPLANKGMARNLAALADFGVFLHLNKCSDLCLVPDFAAVQIDELGQFHITTQLYICRHTEIRIPSVVITPVLTIFHARCGTVRERSCRSERRDRVLVLAPRWRRD